MWHYTSRCGIRSGVRPVDWGDVILERVDSHHCQFIGHGGNRGFSVGFARPFGRVFVTPPPLFFVFTVG